MSSKVYFAPARATRWDYSASQAAGLERLVEKMDFGSVIAEREYVAIKTHFGSWGAHRIVRPRFLRILASQDIVAVEQATLDLINGAAPLPGSLAEDGSVKAGQKILAEILGVDGQLHVDAAAQVGLGDKAYELARV
ncbi:MAG: hypothetical protein JW918_18880 [Anaerolineae bacterium]|nr:hypothetical protein [Anaerolineae bacterium]